MSAADKVRNHSPLKQGLAVTLIKLSGVLPLPVSRCLGSWLGFLGVVFKSQSYRVTQRNLELCYPAMDAVEREQLARQSMKETGRLMLETGSVWLRNYRWLQAKIQRVHNQGILTDAMAAGNGVILLVPHIGNWEVLGLYLARLVPMTSLYQPPDMPALETVIRNAREKSGAKLVPTNRRGVMALVKALKGGELTAILPDQVPDKRAGGGFAPFFSIPALTMTLVTNLRKSANCRIIAGFAERVDRGFDIHFIEAQPGIYAIDQQQALTALNQTVEQCVNMAPAQYQWEYKRFRKQPDKSWNPYKQSEPSTKSRG